MSEDLRRQTTQNLIDRLRADRDSAARRGDHAEALILNDRILDLKSGSSLAVESVMRQFESALVRRRAYGPSSEH
jgi:hypothetical protein